MTKAIDSGKYKAHFVNRFLDYDGLKYLGMLIKLLIRSDQSEIGNKSSLSENPTLNDATAETINFFRRNDGFGEGPLSSFEARNSPQDNPIVLKNSANSQNASLAFCLY